MNVTAMSDHEIDAALDRLWAECTKIADSIAVLESERSRRRRETTKTVIPTKGE